MMAGSELIWKIVTTFWLCCSYMELGICFFLIGPTQLDIRDQNGVDYKTTAWIYISQGIGIICGLLLNCLHVFTRLDGQFTIGLSCLLASVGTFVAGWSRNFFLTNAGFFVQGIAIGVVETVGFFVCEETWASKAPAMFQATVAGMGLGSLLATYLATKFSSYHSATTPEKPEVHSNLSSASENTVMSSVAQNFSSGFLSTRDASSNQVRFAYVITSAMLLTTSLWFLGQHVVRWRPSFKTVSYENLNAEDLNASQKEKRRSSWYFICALNALLVCLATGEQNVLGNLLPMYVFLTYRAQNPHFTTVLWCGFLASRFACVYITLKIGTRNVMFLSLIFATVGALMFMVSFGNIALLWVSVIILAWGIGPTFPASVTWAKENLGIGQGGLSLIFILATISHAGLGAIATYILSVASPWYYGCSVFVLTGTMLVNAVGIACFNNFTNSIKH
ncbi:sodium-dependent glucose transporter 1-like [Lineus longissimus]|uniref:sodium-dependent glucose transporter 1-like n=1 Tax=Lineus longissimus TaxID=88925 RepID=UPI002B4E16EB